jgi:HTH-type transcriptional regulator, global nitrogen regulator NrpRI
LPYYPARGGLQIQDTERKQFHILKVLADANAAVGARLIARRLRDTGIELGEVTVRYYLKLTDERGLTRLVKRRDGRLITDLGRAELKRALVGDKVGFALDRIENLAFRTNFDLDSRTGALPVNVSLFRRDKFPGALKVMKPVFERGLCVSDLVRVADAGEKIGDYFVPDGMVGLATVCSIAVNAALLHANIPINSKFGGVLQMRDGRPLRFVELIYYTGSSLDPSEIFIRAGMTSVNLVKTTGNGEILANFREIPAACLPLTLEISQKLQAAGIGGVLMTGNISEPVCQIHVDVNRVGMVLIGGLNPVAAVREAGIESENHAMSALVDYKDLVKFARVYEERT